MLAFLYKEIGTSQERIYMSDCLEKDEISPHVLVFFALNCVEHYEIHACVYIYVIVYSCLFPDIKQLCCIQGMKNNPVCSIWLFHTPWISPKLETPGFPVASSHIFEARWVRFPSPPTGVLLLKLRCVFKQVFLPPTFQVPFGGNLPVSSGVTMTPAARVLEKIFPNRAVWGELGVWDISRWWRRGGCFFFFLGVGWGGCLLFSLRKPTWNHTLIV